ncbi:hypothetical protein [Neobacillus sp. MER 74]|nr:hypothetical protein [Neobacillus sp. MER 74]
MSSQSQAYLLERRVAVVTGSSPEIGKRLQLVYQKQVRLYWLQ